MEPDLVQPDPHKDLLDSPDLPLSQSYHVVPLDGSHLEPDPVLSEGSVLQVLEKKEVKRWKKSLREVSGLTLCGKRIQQYCDTNKDKRLSQSEWTKCLDVAMGKIKPTLFSHVL